MKSLKWVIPLLFVPAVAAAGEIYQCTANDGSTTFQATPCPQDAKEDRRELQSTASASRSSSRASLSADDADATTMSCRRRVLRDYDDVPKEIEAYYSKRKRQCRQNFHDGSFQIRNCFQEQEEIRTKKYEDMEKYKERALASCGS